MYSLFMTNEDYMLQAIAIAHSSQEDGGAPIGAILVDSKTGEIVASGKSLVGVTHDPTHHAEVSCIRSAGIERRSNNLRGLTLFSTLEPCLMCLGASVWANIEFIYYGAGRSDVSDVWFESELDDELLVSKMHLLNGKNPQIKGGILAAECAAPLNKLA